MREVLALFLDSITTDHISPAGSFKAVTPAGQYLVERQVTPADFNSYGARRGNHEVMMRGTFANIRIKNQMVAGRRRRLHQGPRRQDDADLRRRHGIQGQGHAAGDLCRQGIRHRLVRATGRPRARTLLGVRAVIAQSFERIHRSNLVGMGVLPLVFTDGAALAVAGASPATRPSRSRG